MAGSWDANVLGSGTFTDKFGNVYEGAFASTPTSTNYVAGGEFKLCSGATFALPKPTKAELLAEIESYDKDGNGFIDAEELRAILTRPGTGCTAMAKEEAETILFILTELFDKNSDGSFRRESLKPSLTVRASKQAAWLVAFEAWVPIEFAVVTHQLGEDTARLGQRSNSLSIVGFF